MNNMSEIKALPIFWLGLVTKYLHVLLQVGAVFTALFRQFNWRRAVMITQDADEGMCARGATAITSSMLILQTTRLIRVRKIN